MLEYAFLTLCLGHGTDHDLIRAIAKHESAGNATAFYINNWEKPQYSDLGINTAVPIVETMINEGYTVDVGLMAINTRNIERFKLTLTEAFDPCINVNIGEQILYENMETARINGFSGDDMIKAALSMYNTGSLKRGFQNGYVDKVWNTYVVSQSYIANQSDIDIPWNVRAEKTSDNGINVRWFMRHDHE